MVEKRLDTFCRSEGLDAYTFYAKLQDAQEENDIAKQIIQYLLGATEYRRFVDILCDRKLFYYGPGAHLSSGISDAKAAIATNNPEHFSAKAEENSPLPSELEAASKMEDSAGSKK